MSSKLSSLWIIIGYSGRRIAADLGISGNTVAKYLGQEDFSLPAPAAPRAHHRPVITDKVEAFIENILNADRKLHRTQRHTTKRIYQRLVQKKGFTGSYRSVTRCVARLRARTVSKRRFARLLWQPGTAQVDFAVVDILDAQGATYCRLVDAGGELAVFEYTVCPAVLRANC